ncbi:uncharacterized protein BX663DRAFT_486674 [Cokeromyces recurvatus]|uniref:uncharacterized protein n=1 Tax=Cokeromyces recurvatus TaxID=90255 RepID=UPI00221E529A|nr:uncharacterized protein BX663DRAFT_486674 [Cokeromyces recurvatus]KAI7902355.1 hypothetical protein BX663DRAFT_486674 [Cokeromyces recurvatus]
MQMLHNLLKINPDGFDVVSRASYYNHINNDIPLSNEDNINSSFVDDNMDIDDNYEDVGDDFVYFKKYVFVVYFIRFNIFKYTEFAQIDDDSNEEESNEGDDPFMRFTDESCNFLITLCNKIVISRTYKIEVTALTTPAQHKRILDVKTRGTKRVKLDIPVKKAVIQSTGCIHLNKISNDISFNEIIRTSAYRQLLAFDEYRHITEEHLDILNSHWKKSPFITQESSIPYLSSQYLNKLKITNINMDKLEKLTLGSKTMNLLVISSIRIDDSKLAPEIGPSTKNITPSKDTRIFVSTSSIYLANKILKDPNSLKLSEPLVHLRQLRSKFHQRSTYSLARCYD